MKKSNIISLFILFFISSFSMLGSDSIVIFSDVKAKTNEVIIRWNTQNGFQYLSTQNDGFSIQIFEEINQNRVLKIDTIIKTWSDSIWEQRLDTQNVALLNVYGALYNLKYQNIPNEKSNIAEIENFSENVQALWGMASFSADLNKIAAEAMGLGFSFKREREKDYMVKLFANTSINARSDTIMFYIPKEAEDIDIPCETPLASELEKEIKLKWTHDKKYTAYAIEISEQPNSEFKKINKSPLLPNTKSDNPMAYFDVKLSENYKPFYFRIIGYDMFGEQSLPSDAIKAMGRDRTPPPGIAHFKTTPIDDSTMQLSWGFNKDNFTDIAAILVQRATEIDGEHSEVFINKPSLSDTLFIDKNLPAGKGFYYRFYTLDSVGNYSSVLSYALLPDRIPPAQPKNCKALINEEGIVKITWEMGKEDDLKGYLVFTSNHPNDEFSGVVNKPMYDSVFIDTLSLKMLNREVYYKIIAVDYNFNKSKESEIIKVLRPDTIAPLAPSILNYQANQSNIQLTWIKSSSIDVVKNTLYRIDLSSKDTLLFALNDDETTIVDSLCKLDRSYQYYLTAEDESGNISPKSNEVVLKLINQKVIQAFEDWALSVDSLKKEVTLSWFGNDSIYKGCRILIYKGPDSESLLFINKLPFNSKQFTDKNFNYGNVYYYAIVLVYPDGKKSILSEQKQVLFK